MRTLVPGGGVASGGGGVFVVDVPGSATAVIGKRKPSSSSSPM